MFRLNFTNEYKVVHINNELGNCVIGGAGTYMNELYRYRSKDIGFIYMGLGALTDDYDISDFMEQKDILIMNKDEAHKLADINCDVFVVQFYEFAPFLDEDIIKGKKLVYVIHSVPTPEPPPPWDPFGGNYDIRMKFEKLCNLASVLVCVSQAEKEKLIKIYPQYEEKIKVVYNGITYDESLDLNDNYKHSRKIFGFIGRTDYRKGIYEPFGSVALEAMQRGLPVICSNNGGLDEILEGYKYKYSPYVEGELERTINEFIEDSVENVEEQQRILIKNMSRFSAINMVKEYEKIWDELINEGR